MRTRTTTREGTYNRAANYALKIYIWNLSNYSQELREVYETIKKMEVIKIITDGKQVSDDEKIIEIVNTFLHKKT